ncbi:MAG: serine/threonine protein kinase [Acidobacteriota bacterium]|nr:serine/threonine protein kinase [Acidobacteriota bacterium]
MMNEHQAHSSLDHRPPDRSPRVCWGELRDRYLPVAVENSIWRYSRGALPDDPEQGWKLHIAATVLTAGRVMRVVAPFLCSRGTLYKAPVSLNELDKLNSGIFYGYSQVGKFLTIYPQTTEEAVLLARELHRLTRRMTAPAVPFDLKYRADGCVYYRYGAFRGLEVEGDDGERTYAIRDPEGNLVPDIRDSAAQPAWASDPFLPKRPREAPVQVATPLQTTFKAFRALAQRGRGGVYQALDLSVTPPRLCVMKEGRRNGEMSWDGRDGFWRVQHEQRVLASLLDAGINVPRVYSSFRAEKNYYLAVEFIEGENLNSWLGRKRQRLSIASALRRGIELARIVARMHAAGWVWRDCKPGNIVITKGGELRPLDFEGACPVDSPDPLPWGTPCYTAPEVADAFRGQPRLPEDLYALGAVMYLLIAGRPPDDSNSLLLEKVRKNVPRGACKVVADLLNPDPRQRPAALAAAQRLEKSLSSKTSQRC